MRAAMLRPADADPRRYTYKVQGIDVQCEASATLSSATACGAVTASAAATLIVYIIRQCCVS